MDFVPKPELRRQLGAGARDQPVALVEDLVLQDVTHDAAQTASEDGFPRALYSGGGAAEEVICCRKNGAGEAFHAVRKKNAGCHARAKCDQPFQPAATASAASPQARTTGWAAAGGLFFTGGIIFMILLADPPPSVLLDIL